MEVEAVKCSFAVPFGCGGGFVDIVVPRSLILRWLTLLYYLYYLRLAALSKAVWGDYKQGVAACADILYGEQRALAAELVVGIGLFLPKLHDVSGACFA